MLTLSRLGDVTRYYTENFRNKVYLFIKDGHNIICNGITLAARSTVMEEIIQDSEKIKASQFSDNLPGLFLYLDLIYGGSIEIDDETKKVSLSSERYS